METQSLSFKGNEIKPSFIERIWQEIKQELAHEDYPVESINMPKIVGITLTWNRLKKAWEQTSSSPHLLNTSQAEWGKTSTTWKACTFFSDVNQLWLILVWEKARPIRHEVRHELLHIWESLLGLEWGTLTQNNTNFTALI